MKSYNNLNFINFLFHFSKICVKVGIGTMKTYEGVEKRGKGLW